MHWEERDGALFIALPITQPTSKVRVKRQQEGREGDPVACRSNPILNDDYAEWQVGYDTEDQDEVSVMPGIVLNKPQGVRYPFELIRMLFECRRLEFISNDTFEQLRQEVNTERNEGIESHEQIVRVQANNGAMTLGELFGFVRYELHVPNYLLITPHYSIELKLAHKQRAVGNQAMVYVHLPMIHCIGNDNRNFIGRIAEKNELAWYRIDHQNAMISCDAIRGFIAASENHRRDIRQILAELQQR